MSEVAALREWLETYLETHFDCIQRKELDKIIKWYEESGMEIGVRDFINALKKL